MKQIARLICFISICLLFLIFALFSYPFLISQRARSRFNTLGIQIWARLLLRLIGIKVIAHGLNPEYRNSHYLLVSNHQSYLDIVIIAAVFPAMFVAKREVGGWPILGLLAKLGGTIFVKREDTLDSVRCAYRVSRSLRNGSSVQVFPESTTSDGTQVLPFKGLFFASAIRAGAQILPLTINFRIVNGRPLDNQTREALCWYGEMDFFPHFWNLLKIDSAEISLMFHQPIKTSREYRVEAIARRAQYEVSNGFDYDKTSAIEAARAEVPVEFAAAREQAQTIDPAENEDDRTADIIIGALLHSLFAPNKIDEMEPIKNTLTEESRK
jgi:1-acyl-sn-glycerol-3-phosphate acyltransferase